MSTRSTNGHPHSVAETSDATMGDPYEADAPDSDGGAPLPISSTEEPAVGALKIKKKSRVSWLAS